MQFLLDLEPEQIHQKGQVPVSTTILLDLQQNVWQKYILSVAKNLGDQPND